MTALLKDSMEDDEVQIEEGSAYQKCDDEDVDLAVEELLEEYTTLSAIRQRSMDPVEGARMVTETPNEIMGLIETQSLNRNATAASIPATPGFNTSRVQAALAFERSTWANGSVEDDDFYHVPSNTTDLPAGTLLKLEIFTNTSLYTLPPQTALSRIIFQSEDFNGSLVPVSAFIQWPYSPRVVANGTYPIVAWAHGTSGAFPACAPSHFRNLANDFSAPFTLALQGYVVVAPDYAGLGVPRTADGRPTIHQYLASQAAANDLLYAVEAAQSAFPQLSEGFVVMGHSQGGGAAWAAAERQAKIPVAGYLGAVVISPLTNFIEILQVGFAPLGVETALAIAAAGIALAMHGIRTVFPNFDVREILTSAGISRLDILERVQGCNSVAAALFTSETTPTIQPNVLDNSYVNVFQDLVTVGGKNITGPMLVLQGTGDTSIPANITTKYVNLTNEKFPDTAIDYITYEEVEHAPTLYTSQRDWLGWIERRFSGKSETSGLRVLQRKSALPQHNYQANLNWPKYDALRSSTLKCIARALVQIVPSLRDPSSLNVT
ncbi:MAG: hypothetical protein Q9209_005159 [Squamulea sp. 1 TL-2023]